MALNRLLCADVPLSNYSLTPSSCAHHVPTAGSRNRAPIRDLGTKSPEAEKYVQNVVKSEEF